MTQASAPSGQNQMNGTGSPPRLSSNRRMTPRISVSTDTSTGHRGKSMLRQSRKCSLCKCFRTATGSAGRQK
jgi:hypothetical protein